MNFYLICPIVLILACVWAIIGCCIFDKAIDSGGIIRRTATLTVILFPLVTVISFLFTFEAYAEEKYVLNENKTVKIGVESICKRGKREGIYFRDHTFFWGMFPSLVPFEELIYETDVETVPIEKRKDKVYLVCDNENVEIPTIYVQKCTKIRCLNCFKCFKGKESFEYMELHVPESIYSDLCTYIKEKETNKYFYKKE